MYLSIRPSWVGYPSMYCGGNVPLNYLSVYLSINLSICLSFHLFSPPSPHPAVSPSIIPSGPRLSRTLCCLAGLLFCLVENLSISHSISASALQCLSNVASLTPGHCSDTRWRPHHLLILFITGAWAATHTHKVFWFWGLTQLCTAGTKSGQGWYCVFCEACGLAYATIFVPPLLTKPVWVCVKRKQG